jgi:hypothetical protein
MALVLLGASATGALSVVTCNSFVSMQQWARASVPRMASQAPPAWQTNEWWSGTFVDDDVTEELPARENAIDLTDPCYWDTEECTMAKEPDFTADASELPTRDLPDLPCITTGKAILAPHAPRPSAPSWLPTR